MPHESPIPVNRLPIRIAPDPSRVICRFFVPGDEARIRRTIQRITRLSDEQVSMILARLEFDYGKQHEDIAGIWKDHFERIKEFVPEKASLDPRHELLIGAYFTMEYSLESAALFNPSMVKALDQTGIPEGCTRFFMSLRATGEGHLSSIVFRRGVIDAENRIRMEPVSPLRRKLKKVEDRDYDTMIFRKTLEDAGALTGKAEEVLARLGERFTLHELNEALERTRPDQDSMGEWDEACENMVSLARSNYKLFLPEDGDPSEIVIFPSSENESRGIEDVRLVRFHDGGGSVKYYGTYTAYNGFVTIPTLLETSDDFKTMEVHPIHGRYAKNKGMALFPRKINGRYVMSGRLDGENLFILESDDVRSWNEGRLAQVPRHWWEMMIIGNCGSPLETEEGWLLLTHGVGPMRQYCIGAALLDLEDPSRVISATEHPLIIPIAEERIGYVPNVVYSCGAMIHNGQLVIPYAMSDMVTTICTVSLDKLLGSLKGR